VDYLKEYLDEIKETEQKAKYIIEEAEKEAKARINRANEEAEEFLLKVRKEAEEKGVLLLKEARGEATKEVERIKRMYDEKIREILNNTRPRIEKASELILEKVVNFYVNS